MNIELPENLPPILDFEASGLDSKISYPISLGIVAGGRSYYWLIRPKPEWTHWSDEAEKIHGLTRGYILENGEDSDLVRQSAKAILDNYPEAYSDEPFWDRFWAGRLGLSDLKIKDVRGLLPDGKENDLEVAVSQVIRSENLTHHQAEHDAIAITLAVYNLVTSN